MEIIKRLLQKQLIKEFNDLEDRRAKRVMILHSGREELEILTPKINEILLKYSEKLEPQEVNQFNTVLQKLMRK